MLTVRRFEVKNRMADGGGVRQITNMNKRANTAYVSEIDTPLGTMCAAATDTHLVLLEFVDRPHLPDELARIGRRLGAPCVPGERPIHAVLRSQFAEYYAGTRASFDVPLLYPGTEFQERVWSELLRIPPGTTCSYLSLAKAIGNAAAVRAVARANGDNRIAILIPCHRVIGADGSLTGYGGGLWRKQRLLDLEAGVRSLL